MHFFACGAITVALDGLESFTFQLPVIINDGSEPKLFCPIGGDDGKIGGILLAVRETLRMLDFPQIG